MLSLPFSRTNCSKLPGLFNRTHKNETIPQFCFKPENLMMKKIILFLLALAISSVIPASAAADYEKTKIAVLDFDLKGEGFETDDMGAIVAEWFITALVKEGRFDVIERSLLNKILEEQKLGISGVVDEETATELGKLLGVKVIISGSVLRVQHILEINARIIDVETAAIIAAENVRSATAERLQDLVVQMSVKIIKHFPLEGYVVSREPNETMIAIDLGIYAGVKTGMEFIVFKEGKVIKHPKTGEVLDVQRLNLGRVVVVNVRDKIAEAEIMEEKSPGAIQFGHRVKSLGPLIPVAKPIEPQPIPKDVRARERRGDRSVEEITEMLRSPNLRYKTKGAQYTVRYYPTDPALLEVAETELLKGYMQKTKDRHYIDAMAWLCNVLGRSGQVQYKDTLKEVSKNAGHRKIRKYAKKNYKLLK
jgi:TolB-like protein